MQQQLANLQGSLLHLSSSDALYNPHVIGCHWLCEGPGRPGGFATKAGGCRDLCGFKGCATCLYGGIATVVWKLVRMLPTMELVRRADCPQCVGSVLPSDSHLGSA